MKPTMSPPQKLHDHMIETAPEPTSIDEPSEKPYENPSQEPPAYPGPASAPVHAFTVDEPVALGDGFTNAPHTGRSGTRFREPPRWLQINLFVCKVTAWIMFIVAIIDMAFAGVVMEDLKDECVLPLTCRGWHKPRV